MADHATLVQHEADWDDVDLSVASGASRSHMAVVRSSSPSPDERIYELKTVRDEPAWVVATRPSGSSNPPPPPPGVLPLQHREDIKPVTITLRAQVGHFGDPDREARLLRRIQHRLDQLKTNATFPDED